MFSTFISFIMARRRRRMVVLAILAGPAFLMGCGLSSHEGVANNETVRGRPFADDRCARTREPSR